MKYSEKLKDPRWQKRRLEIFQSAGFRCEECKSNAKELSVHHTAYLNGREPWDYPDTVLMCLCADCHEKRQLVEESIRMRWGEITRCLNVQELEETFWSVAKKASDIHNKKFVEEYAKSFS